MNKIKGIFSSRAIFIRDVQVFPYASQHVYNHSPDGFNWGYSGSGPAQLVLALLLYYTNDKEFSLRNYGALKWDIIAGLKGDFEIDEKVIEDWIEKTKTAEAQQGKNN